MRILGIETSCDETAVAVVECSGGLTEPVFNVLSSVVSSQMKLHSTWGGVVPNIAKREHQINLIPVLKQALEYRNEEKHKAETAQKPNKGSLPFEPSKLESILEREQELCKRLIPFLESEPVPDIDAIAVTQGPGLEPALWVGVNFARALAHAWQKPLYAANHMEGHILAALLGNSGQRSKVKGQRSFPILALLVSGGHTELDVAQAWGKYETIGETRDDAVGEAFDKVARLLGLPYPGGPEISRLAEQAEQAVQGGASALPDVSLPRPMLHSGDFNFSFSGLKTAVRYFLEKQDVVSEELKAAVALEFEQAAVEVLVDKTRAAMMETGAQTFILGGGVAANTRLRRELERLFLEEFPDAACILPERKLTTDNAAMIAAAGYIRSLVAKPVDPMEQLTAVGKLRIDTITNLTT